MSITIMSHMCFLKTRNAGEDGLPAVHELTARETPSHFPGIDICPANHAKHKVCNVDDGHRSRSCGRGMAHMLAVSSCVASELVCRLGPGLFRAILASSSYARCCAITLLLVFRTSSRSRGLSVS